jgi:hypothetical protein
MDLGLAVSDYNSKDTEVFDEIIKLSLAYVSKVKQAVMEGQIRENDIADYFALLGASWASIQPRVQNEYSVTEAHTPMADPHTVVAKAAAAAAVAVVEAKAAKAVEAKAAASAVAPVAEPKSVSFSDVVKAPAAAATAAKAAVPALPTPASGSASKPTEALAKVTDALKKAASK